MNRLIAWFAHNRVAANLIMLVMVVGGFLSLGILVMEVFPEIEADMVTVQVDYPGSTPEEVEELVCVRIEEVVHDLEGVKRVVSKAMENQGTVMIEAQDGYDVQLLLDEIQTRVATINNFPEEAEKPLITKSIRRREVLDLALYGPTDERSLKVLGERIRDEIAALPGITQVELAGGRDYEVSIEVPEEALRRHGLTLEQVAEAVDRHSLNLSGGAVKAESGEVLLRTEGQAYRGRSFEDIPIYTRSDGTTLKLGEIGRVRDGFTETDTLFTFDGKPAVEIVVYRVGDQNILDVAAKVMEYVEMVRPSLPPGMKLENWHDHSDLFKGRLTLLGKNGLSGLVLVLVLLALFLKPRVAFWVALGIPISFLGTIWVMPGLTSLHMMTMFAFILVLGIVVDDAIVVGESVYSYQEAGLPPLEAAVRGAQEVAKPVIFAVLTTVAAFVPMLRIHGQMGVIWSSLPLVVIPCLLFSLVESLLVLPAHLAHFGPDPSKTGKGKKGKPGPLNALSNLMGRGLKWFTGRVYGPFLESCLSWRYLTLAVFVCFLLLTASLIPGGRLKFVFWPDIESDSIVAYLETAPGTPFQATREAAGRLEKAAAGLDREYREKIPGGPRDMVIHVLTTIEENKAQVRLELLPSEDRAAPGLGAAALAQRWLEIAGPIPEAVSLTTRASLGRANRPIEIQLAGRDLEHLVAAARGLKAQLRQYPGISEVEDSFRPGKKEIKLTLKPQAANLDLSVRDLARQVRQAFYGAEAQRFVRDRDEIKVMVRYPEQDRQSLANLEQMRVRAADGRETPISAVADFHLGRGFASIERADRQRVVTITAKVDSRKGNANEIMADLTRGFLADLHREMPGVRYSLEGQLREQEETFTALIREFGLALFIIFALMAIPFRSYLQPLIVMAIIPFSLIGAVLGHLMLGMDLNILSAMGFVALAGVVVNDSLVLVDYINRNQGPHEALHDTVVRAGSARFRPILLTSLTTFGGLAPLILEQSRQAKFLIPMAVSLAFGVLLATFVTLLLVPTSYMILEDLKAAAARLGKRLRGKEKEEPAARGTEGGGAEG